MANQKLYDKAKRIAVKNWSGSTPIYCDACNIAFGKFFIDGNTVSGRWGLFCESCHSEIGIGLGVGKGQKYDRKTLLRVEWAESLKNNE